MGYRILWLHIVPFFCINTVFADEAKVTPATVPPTVRVQSAAPRGKVWERLSDKEKKLAYHLIQAANAGRDLLFYQTNRHSLKIKHLLEASLSADHLTDTKALLGEKPFAEYLV